MTATATYVESENTEIILGEHSCFESAAQMMTQDHALIHIHISGALTVTKEVIDTAREGGRGNLGFARFTFNSGEEHYQSLNERMFIGEGQLFMGTDNRLYIEYGISEIVPGN
ncbi:hypothetical protein N7471_002712 [Penicillium samsonianum]|uniref:uncharacterized protein n=1 Tax=Penicillium samsonianum TaxID=1882272 RepID=UPI002548A805|nr:uncharacterized protein N7471_002712 [Penicillium samsonianum]KAJ6143259.1 hypothetical protein N7471_002712 [Penicillium samsonianum]